MVKRDKNGYYVIIKESIYLEYATIVNICAPNIEAPKYIQQRLTEVKRVIKSNMIINSWRI